MCGTQHARELKQEGRCDESALQCGVCGWCRSYLNNNYSSCRVGRFSARRTRDRDETPTLSSAGVSCCAALILVQLSLRCLCALLPLLRACVCACACARACVCVCVCVCVLRFVWGRRWDDFCCVSLHVFRRVNIYVCRGVLWVGRAGAGCLGSSSSGPPPKAGEEGRQEQHVLGSCACMEAVVFPRGCR